MSRKKSILVSNEASYLSTGFSVYGHEVLKRLHATDKYNLFELGSYGMPGDPRQQSIPWAFMPVMPEQGNEEQQRAYESNPINQFGEWKFEEACLRHKADVVLDFRDNWMLSYQEFSPFRPLFHWSIMPTVDAAPQDEGWISTYANADSVFTYTDWALDVLRNQGGTQISLKTSAPPGADMDVFKPVPNHKQHRESMGLDPGSFIVGTVMRNQRRKLYPDLFQAFAQFLREAPQEIANRTYLYIHSSFPDLGWDIPRMLLEEGLGGRCLFTYLCKACNAVYPSFYADAKSACRRCGEHAAGFPNSHHGVTRETIAAINGLFDGYVQYANCLTPETQVLVKRGWVPIENVCVGDVAFTHTGTWKKVVNTFAHENGDSPLDIVPWSDYERLTITSEHPVFAITRAMIPASKGRSLREQAGTLLRTSKLLPDPVFVPANKLSVGDLLAYRIDDSIVDVEKVDLAPYARTRDSIYEDTISIKYGKSLPRYIKVDLEFCRYLGLYAANGSSAVRTGTGSIRVTSNLDDNEQIELAEKVMTNLSGFNATRTYYKNRHALNVESYNKLLAIYFASECGKLTSKRLPEWTLQLPLDKQREIIRGLFMADGCWVPINKTTAFVTTSPILASQVKTILRRVRMYFNVRIVKPKGKRKPQYRFEVPGNIDTGIFTTKRSSSASLYYGPWHLIKIKSIKPSNYNGQVYNFEVETDNSYMTKLGLVHNSEGMGMPQVEAASCGVPVFAVDYSAMSDVVRKINGYPIKVQRLTREAETHCWRALPDNNDFVEKLIKFLQLPEGVRKKKGFEARAGVAKHYTYDRTAKIWEDHLDSIPVSDKWNSPSRARNPETSVPAGLTNEQFVRWGLSNVACRPDLTSSYMALRMTRDLNWGACLPGAGGSYFNEASVLGSQQRYQEFNRERAMHEFLGLNQKLNYWEHLRCSGKVR